MTKKEQNKTKRAIDFFIKVLDTRKGRTTLRRFGPVGLLVYAGALFGVQYLGYSIQEPIIQTLVLSVTAMLVTLMHKGLDKVKEV
jgi:hypothetical protein